VTTTPPWTAPGQLRWFRSSLSRGAIACVEVASMPAGQVGVRSGRDGGPPVLRFTPDEWFAFIAGVRNGEFDLIDGY
jgi:hypothetical protein